MVLFENENFIVIDKRAGWLSIPGRMAKTKPEPCELDYWQDAKQKKLWVVHRLDREVSGVMCFALSETAHRAANGWFEQRTIHKTYEAFAETSREIEPPEPAEQRWQSRLLRGKKRAYEKPFGKPSVTLARYRKNYDYHGLSLELWELQPLTGRPHQLRYEMTHHQRPIWGDKLYGSQLAFPVDNAIALRAVKLSFAEVADREKWALPPFIQAAPLTAWLRDYAAQRQ